MIVKLCYLMHDPLVRPRTPASRLRVPATDPRHLFEKLGTSLELYRALQ